MKPFPMQTLCRQKCHPPLQRLPFQCHIDSVAHRAAAVYTSAPHCARQFVYYEIAYANELSFASTALAVRHATTLQQHPSSRRLRQQPTPATAPLHSTHFPLYYLALDYQPDNHAHVPFSSTPNILAAVPLELKLISAAIINRPVQKQSTRAINRVTTGAFQLQRPTSYHTVRRIQEFLLIVFGENAIQTSFLTLITINQKFIFFRNRKRVNICL